MKPEYPLVIGPPSNLFVTDNANRTYQNLISRIGDPTKQDLKIIAYMRELHSVTPYVIELDDVEDNKLAIQSYYENLSQFNLIKFKNGERNKESFIETEFITLDLTVDGDLQDINIQFLDNELINCSFISALLEGIVVVLRMENVITDVETYLERFKHYANLYKYYCSPINNSFDPFGNHHVSFDPDIRVTLDYIIKE